MGISGSRCGWEVVGKEVVRGILDGRMGVAGGDVEVLGHQAGAVCDDQL